MMSTLEAVIATTIITLLVVFCIYFLGEAVQPTATSTGTATGTGPAGTCMPTIGLTGTTGIGITKHIAAEAVYLPGGPGPSPSEKTDTSPSEVGRRCTLTGFEIPVRLYEISGINARRRPLKAGLFNAVAGSVHGVVDERDYNDGTQNNHPIGNLSADYRCFSLKPFHDFILG